MESETGNYVLPRRQAQALLLFAAARSAGVRREPAPVVRQTALEDACFLPRSVASSFLPYFFTSSTRLFSRTRSLE